MATDAAIIKNTATATPVSPIRAIRETLGLTQPQFAMLAGLSLGAIWQWEHGMYPGTGRDMGKLGSLLARLGYDPRGVLAQYQAYVAACRAELWDQVSSHVSIVDSDRDRVTAARRLLAEGRSVRDVAKRMGMSKSWAQIQKRKQADSEDDANVPF